MVVKCSKDELAKVIDYARNSKLVYLKIEKKDDILIMDYKLIDNIKKESVLLKTEHMLKTSLKTTFDLIGQLEKLHHVINVDITPISYTLTYDCTVNSNIPLYSLSSALPNSIVIQPKKEVEIDWDNMFADKLDQEVPGLYSKKAAKKYAPVTYRELVEILRN